jgi:tetratricopeptide (TPR) repeat protein
MTQENSSEAPQPTSVESPKNATNPSPEAKTSPVAFSPLVFGVVLFLAIVVAIVVSPKEISTGNGNRKNLTVEGQEAPFRKYIRDAHENAEQGFDEAAMSDLKKAHQMAPEEAETNAELGAFMCKMRRYKDAEPFLARARQLDPKKAQLAGVYATCLAKLGQSESALKEIAEACRLAPNDQDILYMAGTLCVNAFREEQAIIYLSLLLKMSPRHKEAMRLLAHAETLRGNHKGAVDVLKRFLNIHPDDAPAHESYQQASLRAGLGEELIRDYQYRYGETPNMMHARLLSKALAYFPARMPLARRILKEALAKAATNIDLQVEAAALDYLHGDFKSSIEWLERVVHSKKAPVKAFLVRALVARAQKDTKTAVTMFERALKLDPISAHLGMISLMRDNKAYKRALDRIKALQEQSPPAGKAMLAAVAAEVFAEANQVDKSITTFTKAVAKGEGRPEVYEGMGRELIVKGRIVEAIRALTSGLPRKNRDPNRTRGREPLLLWRAVANQLSGNVEAAKKDLRDVALSEKTYLPFAAYTAIAKHMLGEMSAKDMKAIVQFHGKGPFYINDRLFFEGLTLEGAGKKAEALERYKAARKATIGDESPARLIDIRIAVLSKK